MKEHICEKCKHEKECRNMVCFYELFDKEEKHIRAEEKAKVVVDIVEKISHLDNPDLIKWEDLNQIFADIIFENNN